MTITVYGYHPFHGGYAGETDADESPLEPGVYLDPAFTTRAAPPDYAAGKIPVWRGNRWEVAPDHCGETWYDTDGAAVLIEVPGDPVARGLSKSLPKPPPALRSSLSKTEIYSRMTDDELDTFDEAIENADRRTRLMWRDCLEVRADSDLFPVLQAQIEAAFGEDRMAAILSLKPD